MELGWKEMDSSHHASHCGPPSGMGFTSTGDPPGLPAAHLDPPWGRVGQHFARISVHPANSISLFSVERENVQKRTFTRWVNLHLEKCNPPLEVKDLFVDIQDGKILMALLEVLSGRNLVRMSRKGQAGIKCKGKHCWRFALSTPLDIGTRTWPCVIL
uniref:Calponin-homology (CH) domain-containing protein n=1 Tax=Canis lupus dingo TaxID=286419 RepID=A0A8C0KMY4_CANLU